VSEPRQDLAAAWRALSGQWLDTRAHWDDAVAQEFERRYWTEMQQQMKDLMQAAEQLEETYSRALRSCD
jgi:hypothetical protein